MKRKASATWNGGLKDGKGIVSTDSNVLLNAQYSFTTRFENGKGTNPEELVAAAHAACYAMALSAQLSGAGMNPERVSATATVTLDKLDKGWTITESHLDVVAKVPNADPARFQEIAAKAKAECPISRLLNANVTLTATLEAVSRAGG